jgi:hypothetical protein
MSVTTYLTGGLALVVAALYFMWSLEAKKVERRDDELASYKAVQELSDKAFAQVQETNEAALAAVERLKADVKRQSALAAKYDGIARQRDVALKNALKRISDAPTSEDGPVAPVLQRELDSLRVVGGEPAPADGDHEDPSRSLPDLIEPVLPATPAAPGS